MLQVKNHVVNENVYHLISALMDRVTRCEDNLDVYRVHNLDLDTFNGLLYDDRNCEKFYFE